MIDARYITASDIRRALRLSRSASYRLAHRLPGTVTIGRALRVPLNSFEDFIRNLPSATRGRDDTALNEIWSRLGIACAATEIAAPVDELIRHAASTEVASAR